MIPIHWFPHPVCPMYSRLYVYGEGVDDPPVDPPTNGVPPALVGWSRETG
jgi:hypothetical protein